MVMFERREKMKIKSLKYYAAFLVFVLAFKVNASTYKPIELDPNYLHDRWVTQPQDIIKEFRAYTTSFDSKDDDIALGIPEWVAYEIKPHPQHLGAGPARPSKWLTDSDQGLAPTDDSYKNSKYDRGHMCQKYIAWRLGANTDWNTHTTLNACPQSATFNRGIWENLERRTSDWADTSGNSVWVICGPVILDNAPIHWIGSPGEIRVAVPHAFYKIVVRESQDPNRPDVLALLYPHHHLYVQRGPHNHIPYLVSIDYIEELTGLNFLTVLQDNDEQAIEQVVAASLWQ
jgi:DNA/RNA endonuclease G (NUC1)